MFSNQNVTLTGRDFSDFKDSLKHVLKLLNVKKIEGMEVVEGAGLRLYYHSPSSKYTYPTKPEEGQMVKLASHNHIFNGGQWYVLAPEASSYRQFPFPFDVDSVASLCLCFLNEAAEEDYETDEEHHMSCMSDGSRYKGWEISNQYASNYGEAVYIRPYVCHYSK